MTKPTNRQVFDYYATKNAHALTQQYVQLRQYQERGVGFKPLFKTFTKPNQAKVGDNLSFYQLLRHWKKQQPLHNPIIIYNKNNEPRQLPVTSLIEINAKLSSLIQLEDLHLLNPAKDGVIEIDQKWHLSISIIAYNAVCGFDDHTGWMWDHPHDFWAKDFPAPMTHFSHFPLKLWMIENCEHAEFQRKYIDDIRRSIHFWLENQTNAAVQPADIKYSYDELTNSYQAKFITDAYDDLLTNWASYCGQEDR